jgi:kumamolisin
VRRGRAFVAWALIAFAVGAGPGQAGPSAVAGRDLGPADPTRTNLASVRVGGLTPVDILRAYDIQPLRDLGIDGTSQTVVVTVPRDGYSQAALDTFTTRFGLPAIHVESRADDPLALANVGELELDLEIIHAIAPGAKLVVYAWAANSGDAAYVARAIEENPGAILSQSWHACEQGLSAATLEAYRAALKRASEQSETVFSATGDGGAYACLTQNEDWGTPPSADRIGAVTPASVPFGIAVGGTRLSVRTDGSYYRETVWEWPAMTEASGGGASTYFARPDWQFGPGLPAADAQTHRLTPDVAAVAEGGMAIFTTAGGWELAGGTSESTPIWAGITALINGYLRGRGLPAVGAFAPALYALARSPQPYPPYHDVVVGGNLVELAGPGWDSSTGLGSPDAYDLARDVEAYMRAGSPP